MLPRRPQLGVPPFVAQSLAEAREAFQRARRWPCLSCTYGQDPPREPQLLFVPEARSFLCHDPIFTGCDLAHHTKLSKLDDPPYSCLHHSDWKLALLWIPVDRAGGVNWDPSTWTASSMTLFLPPKTPPSHWYYRNAHPCPPSTLSLYGCSSHSLKTIQTPDIFDDRKTKPITCSSLADR